MKNVKLRWIIALAVLLLIASVQWSVQRTSPDTGSAAATDVAMNVVQASRQVLEALRARDGDRLAELTHPTKGVRFSPYAYVDVHKDRVFFKEQIRRFWDDRMIYMWGHVDASGEPIALTGAEFNLLLAFVEHPNRVLSRDQIADFTRRDDWDAFDRSIDTQISRLRKKIEAPGADPVIQTVRGEGYVLAAAVAWSRA